MARVMISEKREEEEKMITTMQLDPQCEKRLQIDLNEKMKRFLNDSRIFDQCHQKQVHV